MNAWKIHNAGLKEEGAGEWVVKSHGSQRLLWARLGLMFGPAAVLFIVLNTLLDDSGAAACVVLASLVVSIPLALSFNSKTTLSINEFSRTMSISGTLSFLFGVLHRERTENYVSADIRYVDVQGNLLGSNWRTELETHNRDSVTVYFRGNEENARRLAGKVAEIGDIELSTESTPEIDSEVVEKGVETWRLALAVIYGLLVSLLLGYAWFLIAQKLEFRSGWIALLIGLVIGIVVSFMAGGSRHRAYGLLGAFVAGVGIAFGEFLTFGSTMTPFIYECDPTLVIIYLLGVYEGYIIPRRSIPLIREKSQIIVEDSWQRLAVVGAALLVGFLAVGIMVDLIPTPNETLAKSNLVRAAGYLVEDRFQEAEEAVEKAIGYKEDYAEAWFLLASVQAMQGDFNEIEDSLIRAITFDSSLYIAHIFLADMYLQQGLYQRAIDDINAIIEQDMESSDRSLALTVRGNSLGMLGQHERAIEDCQAALKADNQQPIAHYVCGINFYALGENQEAIEHLNAYLSGEIDYFTELEVLRLINEIGE